MNDNKSKIETLYSRALKLQNVINEATKPVEGVNDSYLILDVKKDNSYDTKEKAVLAEYSINGGNEEKDSISNSYIENSNIQNGPLDLKKYNTLQIKIEDLSFIKDIYGIESPLIEENDIVYIEGRIPVNKNQEDNILYDNFKIYIDRSKKKKDDIKLKKDVYPIKQLSIHKLNMNQELFPILSKSNIVFFVHKIVLKKKLPSDSNGAKKKKVTNTEDIILGYGSLNFSQIFFGEELKFKGNINIITEVKEKEKKKQNGRKRKNSPSNKKEEVEKKNIATLNLTCALTKENEKLVEKNIKNQNDINVNLSQNNITSNINNTEMKEYVIGNNINNFSNVEGKNIELKTDLYDDILILFLKINELKITNTNTSSNNNVNIQNLNNPNSLSNNNIISSSSNNPNGIPIIPQKRNYFIMHKIFPKSISTTTDIMWNNTCPNFKYFQQMPFVLNPENAELLDNGIFLIELWNKNEDDEIIGVVKLELRNVLDAMKIDEDTITVNQLYLNNFPYIIYDDFFPVELYEYIPDVGTIFLNIMMGIGTPLQMSRFLEKIKKDDTPRNSIKEIINKEILIRDSQSVDNSKSKNLIPNRSNSNIQNKSINKSDNKSINKSKSLNKSKDSISLDPFRITSGNNFEIKNAYMRKKSEKEPSKSQTQNENEEEENEEEENENEEKEEEEEEEDEEKEKEPQEIKNDKNESISNKSKSKASNIDVDQIMENNNKKVEDLENKLQLPLDTFKKTNSSNFDQDKNNILNPFLVPDFKEDEEKETGAFKNGFQSNQIKDEDNFTINPPQTFHNNLIDTNNSINPNQKKDFPQSINISIDVQTTHQQKKNEVPDFSKSENKELSPKIDNKKFDMFDSGNNFDDRKFEEKKDENIIKEEKKNIEKKKSKKIHKENEEKKKIEKKKSKKIEKEIEKKPDFSKSENTTTKKILEEKPEKKSDSKIKKKASKPKIINQTPINELTSSQNKNIPNSLISSQSNVQNIHSPLKKHIFTLYIDKILNCQILSKLPNCYLRYQFFSDQKPIRSEIFTFSSFSIDSSSIDVDMKSTHSIILPISEKIKDYLDDFLIEIAYNDTNNNNNPVIIGKISVPVEEFYYLIKDNKNNNSEKMTFIYGTEKIQRNKCIIGKIKFNVEYYNEPVLNGNENLGSSISSIYLEKETIFNRKIPKKCILKFYIKNFISNNLFEEYYRKSFSFFFIISPFGSIPKMEQSLGKRTTSKKRNVINGDFNEILIYKLEIDQDIIDYFKCRNGLIYMVYKISAKDTLIDKKDENENENDIDINNIDLSDLNNHKNIIGKGIFNLNEILSSADNSLQSIQIKQIGNDSGSLGTLNLEISLENANFEIEDNKLKTNLSSLYKKYNKSIYNFDPSLYLNGKFLFVIDFSKFYYEISSHTGNYLSTSNNSFYLVFKLGNKIKKISPKFSNDVNEIFSIGSNNNLILLNYTEMIEMNLNFSKKIPFDLYNQFFESVLEIKVFQNDSVNTIGSFYIDLHKLIISPFFSENILYSGNNVINLIDVKNNMYKNAKIEVNIGIFKLYNVPNSNENIDYSEYYQMLFRKDFSENILRNIIVSDDEKNNNIEYIQKIFDFNNINMFSFINDNIIDLIDIKGGINLDNLKKLFSLVTKLNYDLYGYYQNEKIENEQNIFEYYLNSHIINYDNDDMNILNYLNDLNEKISINVNNQSNKQNYFDSIAFCMFLFDYLYILNRNYILNMRINEDEQNLTDNNNQLLLTENENNNLLPQTKVMYISILSGHNIIKPNSELNERPNCYFILEFDDKNYKSEIIMNSSQPNFNEELEIKINADDYLNKLNSLPILISVFSLEDENNSIFIGRAEIYPHKIFPFLNEVNECEDFYNLIDEDGKIMGQLDIILKFENDINNNNNINRSNLNLVSSIYNNNNGSSNNYNTVNISNNIYDNTDDVLRQKLAEAMQTVDNLTMELKSKTHNLNNNPLFNSEISNSNMDFDSFKNINDNFENLNIGNYNNNKNYNFPNYNNNFNNQNNNIKNDIKIDPNKKNNNNISIMTEPNKGNDSFSSHDNKNNNSFYSAFNERENKSLKNSYKNIDKKLINRIQKVMKGDS